MNIYVRSIRSSRIAHALTITAVLALHIFMPAPVARACADCWPVYYEIMTMKPSNWVTVGQYQPGDVVWRKTTNFVSSRWYVMDAGDPSQLYQPDPCCADGPYFIDNYGGLFSPY